MSNLTKASSQGTGHVVVINNSTGTNGKALSRVDDIEQRFWADDDAPILTTRQQQPTQLAPQTSSGGLDASLVKLAVLGGGGWLAYQFITSAIQVAGIAVIVFLVWKLFGDKAEP